MERRVTVDGITFIASCVFCGSSSTGSVTITGPAPVGGLVVAVSKTGTATTVPATVTVAAGQSVAPFTVTSTAVGTDSDSTHTVSANGPSK